MTPRENLAEVFDADAGVDSSRLEAFVAEELLDVTDAGLSFEEMSRVGVAQCVREDRGLDRSSLRVVGEEHREKASTDPAALLGEEERGLSRRLHELGPTFTQIMIESGSRPSGERDHAVFLSFAVSNEEKLLAEVDVADVEPQTLAAAETRSVKNLEEGAVAPSEEARA
jgi:hypothetical protein